MPAANFTATSRKDKDGRKIYTKDGMEYVKRKVISKSKTGQNQSKFVMSKIKKPTTTF